MCEILIFVILGLIILEHQWWNYSLGLVWIWSKSCCQYIARNTQNAAMQWYLSVFNVHGAWGWSELLRLVYLSPGVLVAGMVYGTHLAWFHKLRLSVYSRDHPRGSQMGIWSYGDIIASYRSLLTVWNLELQMGFQAEGYEMNHLLKLSCKCSVSWLWLWGEGEARRWL